MKFQRLDRAVILVTMIVLLGLAVWGYRGSQSEILGPPFHAAGIKDVGAYFQAAQYILEGYSPYKYTLAQQHVPSMAQHIEDPIAYYIYPPTLALVFTMLVRLNPDIHFGAGVWAVINTILLVALAAMAVFTFSSVTHFFDRMLRIVLLMEVYYYSATTHYVLSLGQSDVVIAFALLLVFFLYKKGFDTGAMMVLALVVTIKPTLVILVTYFLWKRHRRMVVIFGTAVAFLLIASFTITGWQRLAEYIIVSSWWASANYLALPINQSVTALALRMFTSNAYIEPLSLNPLLSSLIPLAVSALGVILWFVLVTPADNRRTVQGAMEYNFTLMTLMVISPIMQDNHIVWTLPLISMWIMILLDRLRRPIDFAQLGGLIVIALYLGYPALRKRIYSGYEAVLQDNLVASQHVFASGSYLYGIIALYALAAAALFAIRRANRIENPQPQPTF